MHDTGIKSRRISQYKRMENPEMGPIVNWFSTKVPQIQWEQDNFSINGIGKPACVHKGMKFDLYLTPYKNYLKMLQRLMHKTWRLTLLREGK